MRITTSFNYYRRYQKKKKFFFTKDLLFDSIGYIDITRYFLY